MKAAWLIPVTLLTTTSVQAVDFSGTVTLASDYRTRGNSLTLGKPALQASIDAGFESGIYLGIWGSNVDFGDDARVEVEYYVGYANQLMEDLGYAATLYYYDYHGYEEDNFDYPEISLRLFYKGLTLTQVHTHDYIHLGSDARYTAIDYRHPLTELVQLNLHAGYTYGEAFADNEQSDYSLGLSGHALGLKISADYLVVDPKQPKRRDFNDNTFVFKLSRTF